MRDDGGRLELPSWEKLDVPVNATDDPCVDPISTQKFPQTALEVTWSSKQRFFCGYAGRHGVAFL